MSQIEQLYDYVNGKLIDSFNNIDTSIFPKLQDDHEIIHSEDLKQKFLAKLHENRDTELALFAKMISGNECSKFYMCKLKILFKDEQK